MCHNLEGASFHHRYFGPKFIFWLSNVAAIREPPKVESSLVPSGLYEDVPTVASRRTKFNISNIRI